MYFIVMQYILCYTVCAKFYSSIDLISFYEQYVIDSSLYVYRSEPYL